MTLVPNVSNARRMPGVIVQMRLKDTDRSRDNVKVPGSGYPQGHRTGMHLSNRHGHTRGTILSFACLHEQQLLFSPYHSGLASLIAPFCGRFLTWR